MLRNWRGIFSRELKFEEINLEELRKTGKVSEIKEERNGCIVTSISYESTDGTTKWSRIESHPIGYEEFNIRLQLEGELEDAELRQDYERCIEIREKIKHLPTKNKNNVKEKLDNNSSTN